MIIDAIHSIFQESICSNVKYAGMYSVQTDTTQDITSMDQCSVILQYVTDTVYEILVALVDYESSSGQHFADMVIQT